MLIPNAWQCSRQFFHQVKEWHGARAVNRQREKRVKIHAIGFLRLKFYARVAKCSDIRGLG